MKVLSGLHAPDSGQILFQGEPLSLRNPRDVLRRGIAMIGSKEFENEAIANARERFGPKRKASCEVCEICG